MEKKKQRQSMISVRGGFSDKRGIGSISNEIQVNEFDDRTRIIVSNFIRDWLESFFMSQYYDGKQGFKNDFCKSIISNVFCCQIILQSGMQYDWRSVYDSHIFCVIKDAPYNEVLDIIWYIYKWLYEYFDDTAITFDDDINCVFEQECVGYRFVNGQIVEITDENEIKEIEQAASSPFNACRSHIAKAVGFLADRENKDYKNCVKESISAVEAICKIIAAEPSSDLSKAIKHLKKGGIHIHPTLELAWEKIYAYTCDVGGIRHAEKLFESDVTFEEAKYMLISCSAFVNYLITEYGKVKNDEK